MDAAGPGDDQPLEPGRAPRGARPSWGIWFCMLVAAAMLCLAAAWNGQPFFYADTPTYLRGAEMGVTRVVGPGKLTPWLPAQAQGSAANAPTPSPEASPRAEPGAFASLSSVEDKVVLAGRSVYYGALLYLSFLAGSLWFTVLFHGLCVAYVLHLLVVRLWGMSRTAYLGTVAVLATVTPLAIFTGLLMPDIFAGLAILSVATLCVYWSALARSERWVLSAILLFGLVSHSSHIPLAAAVMVAALALRLLPGWRGMSLRALAVGAACIVAALAAEVVFTVAVTKAIGAPPLRLPHLSGRLVDMGPGTEFLRRNCPGAGYAACAYVENFPTSWEDFLFSTDPARGAFALADPAAKRRMSDEQLRLALDVLRHDPAGVSIGIATDILRQAVMFQVDVSGLGTDQLPAYINRVPASVLADMRASRILDSHAMIYLFTALTYLSTAASLALAGLWGWRRWREGPRKGADARQQAFERFAWLAVTGVVANAVICGALASPLDRFQARVVWLLPFLVLSVLLLAAARRRAGHAAPPHAPASEADAYLPPLQGSTP